MADDDRPSPTPTQPPFEPEEPLLTDEPISTVNVPVQTERNVPGPSGYRALTATIPPASTKENSSNFPPIKRFLRSHQRQSATKEQQQPPPHQNVPGPSGYLAPTTTIPPAATNKGKRLVTPPKKRPEFRQQQQQPPPQRDIAGCSSGKRKGAATYPMKRGSKTTIEDRKEIARLRRLKWTVTNIAKEFNICVARVSQICSVESENEPSTLPPQQQQQPPTQRGNAARSSDKRKRAACPKKERQGPKTSVRDRREIAEYYFSKTSTAKQIMKRLNLSKTRLYRILREQVKKDPSLLTFTRKTMTTRATAALPQQHHPPPEQQQQPSPQRPKRWTKFGPRQQEPPLEHQPPPEHQ